LNCDPDSELGFERLGALDPDSIGLVDSDLKVNAASKFGILDKS
jgi:hypothetical protein